MVSAQVALDDANAAADAEPAKAEAADPAPAAEPARVFGVAARAFVEIARV